MTEPSRPTFLRRKLGAKLRRLREQAGMTLDDAAPKLDKARSSLHRIETGETRANVHIVRSMMDLYDCYSEGLLAETRQALKPRWYTAYGLKDLGYLDVETEAAEVRQFSAQVIPGLLQAPGYIRALFQGHHRSNPLVVDRSVEIRGIRQQRLTSEERPLKLVAVIDEAVLRRVVGGPKVMWQQLTALASMTKLPTVTLQVLPLNAGSHSAMQGGFNVLTFPDPEDPPMLYVEYQTGALHIENLEQVNEARLSFDHVQARAMSPAESCALIERLAAEADPWRIPD
ncbi:DNA-binding XRE family transcriptional regulator [Kibdelosporangium banguiense]|uniref:DNA-binding XRE family transcriptional regulator n=1 Tax=Kibdelosporangium banguiense TaxID=1365924 RepID=A0ABS4U2D6_9PSEU|nr:helix-turn-helix transcriptional regulator [Kibdelosporangium banguiense]MBP2330824.1 DNA-binding XRE family transcriptional regulator [Kibdelosporangium banguiense]